ncbi:MAG: hypothetical protein GXO77_05840 [Calditrichaeota bacterium]|nr:hypothetical protein [Calditrichota bacterium]
MAQIILTLDEICRLLYSNIPFKDIISEISVKENKIQIVLKPTGIPASVPVLVSFADFSDGKIHLRVEANPLIKLFAGLLSSNLPSGIEIDLPDIFISVNDFLRKKMSGISVEDIKQDARGSMIISADLKHL